MNPFRIETVFLAAGMFGALVSSGPAHANGGGQEGHGGEVVACFRAESTAERVRERIYRNRVRNERVDVLEGVSSRSFESVVLLDLYEAGGSFVRGLSSEARALERMAVLERTHSLLHREIERSARLLPLQDWVPLPAGISNVDDSGYYGTFPKRCVRLQAAVRGNSRGKATVYYDPRLYARMDETNRAALILHEWIYLYDTWLNEADDSGFVRQLVAEILRPDFGPGQAPRLATLLTGAGRGRVLVDCFDRAVTFRPWKTTCSEGGCYDFDYVGDRCEPRWIRVSEAR